MSPDAVKWYDPTEAKERPDAIGGGSKNQPSYKEWPDIMRPTCKGNSI